MPKKDKPKKVERELPWSWHRSPRWRGQLERVRRWHRRFLTATTPEDAEDFMYAFFQNCYCLRDWIDNSATHDKASLDRFFQDHWQMRLCRDLGNMTKHFELTRPPAMGLEPSIAREYVGRGRGWYENDHALVILSQGTQTDARDLASECLRLWEEFLLGHEIQTPNTP